MILLDELYTITSQHDVDQATSFLVALRPESVIFGAHFPGEPIMPGACIVQMVLELTSLWRKQPTLSITKVNNLKFLSVIKPGETPSLAVNLELRQDDESTLQVRGSLRDEATEFTKFSLTFSK